MDKRLYYVAGFLSIILISSILTLSGWNTNHILIVLNVYSFIIAFVIIMSIDEYSMLSKFIKYITEKLGERFEK